MTTKKPKEVECFVADERICTFCGRSRLKLMEKSDHYFCGYCEEIYSRKELEQGWQVKKAKLVIIK